MDGGAGRAGLDGGDEGTSRRILSEVALSARSRLELAARPDPAWFDGVAKLLMGSGGGNSPELRIECLLLFAEWYFKEGKWPAGIEVAEKAVAIAKLRHPNILAVFDHGEFEGQPYIVTEFVEGGTFAAELGQRIDVERAAGEVRSCLRLFRAR